MDKIPIEIVRAILRNIILSRVQQPLSSYASTSKVWQSIIEEITFQTLVITTTDLATFKTYFAGKNSARLNLLNVLVVEFELPKMKPGTCRLKHKPNRKDDSVAITGGITYILKILAAMDLQLQHRAKPLHLMFRSSFRRNDCTHDHWGVSHLDFKSTHPNVGFYNVIDASELPNVNNIHRFSFFGGNFKGLSNRTLVDVASKFSELRIISLEIEDFYEWGSERRIEQRTDFCNAMAQITGDDLEDISITIWHRIQTNDCIKAHNLIGRGDPLRTMFWNFSQFKQLRKLHLTGPVVIPFDLLAVSLHIQGGSIFPVLEEFLLQFAPETADGQWFLIKDEEGERAAIQNPRWKRLLVDIDDGDSEDSEDSEDSSSHYLDEAELSGDMLEFGEGTRRLRRVKFCQCRSMPNPTTATPLLLDTAELLHNLRRIRKFIIRITWNQNDKSSWKQFERPWIGGRDFEIQYLKRGVCWDAGRHKDYPKNFKEDLSTDRLYWRFAERMPADDVQRRWSDVVGPDCKIWRLRQIWSDIHFQGEMVSPWAATMNNY
ncbi:hypothetical protein B0J11DRAFT_601675 [Dendryphion nanum]|uniref:Uncharacterized protein n=1 Tax=Dendryphion nanum TaxID=256645 RepID=A0A9P9I6E7_9PLEO|nr:hypothetical protein B0J11DRAFT_601675 [Dendryphion nanum]